EPEDAASHLALIFSDKVPSLSYDNFLMERADDAHGTLAIIKPDVAGSEAQVLQITRRITARGYTIKDRVEITLSRAQAQAFYAEHQDKPFFDSLVDFMTSGPVIALSLDGDDVIRGWRMMAGQTDPDEARAQTPQSIRALFGSKCPRNAVHGSDSAESAERELAFFFSPRIQPEKEIPSAKEEPSSVHTEETVTQDDDVSTQMGENVSAVVEGDNIEDEAEASTSRPSSGEKKKKKQKKRRNKRKQTVSLNSAGLAADPSSTRDATNASDESDEDKSPSPAQQSSVQVQAGSDHNPVEEVGAEKVNEVEVELPVKKVGIASETAIQSDAPNNSTNNSDNAVKSSVVELAVPSDPANERTFGLIKPDAYPRYRKQLISHIVEKGLIVVAQEEVVLTRDAAVRIYDGIKTFPVFPRVIDFVTSGPVLALVLEGPNAVSVWRGLVGPSHPRTARFEDRNSMRAKYGHDGQKNAVHASKDLQEVRSSIKTVFYDLLGGRFTMLHAGDDPLNVVPGAEKEEHISTGNKDQEALESGNTPDNSADQPAEPQTEPVSETSAGQGVEEPVNETNVETSLEETPDAADSLQEETSVVVVTGVTPLVEAMDNGSVDGAESTVAAIVTENVESNGDVPINEDNNSTEKTSLKDEKPVSSTASLADSPQSKSASVSEKQSSFGSRLASSPFLKADRQVTQDQSATKRVGRIKSPFLGSERAEPVDSSPPSSVPKSIRSSPQASLATVNSEAAHDTKNAPAVEEKDEKTDAMAKSDGSTDDTSACANMDGLNIVESSVPNDKTEEPVCEDDSKCNGKADKDLEKQSSTSTTDESIKVTDAHLQNQPRSNGAVDEKPKPFETNGPVRSTTKPVPVEAAATKGPQRSASTRAPARPAQHPQPATSAVQRAAHKTSTQGPSDTAQAASRGPALRRTTLGETAAKAKAKATTTAATTTTRPARAAASGALGNEAKVSAGSARKLPLPSQPVPVASARTSESNESSSLSSAKPSAAPSARPRVVARSASVKTPVSSRQPLTATRTRATPGDAEQKNGVESSTSNGPPPRRTASVTRAPARALARTPVAAVRPRVAPSSTAASVSATKSAGVSSTPAARTPGASLSTPRRAIAQGSTAASSTTPAVSRSRAAPAQPPTASSAASSRTTTPRPMLTRPTAPAVSVASTASSRARAARAAEARAAEAKTAQTHTFSSGRTAAGVRQAPALARRVSRTSTTTTSRPVAKPLPPTGSFARRTAASSARAAIPTATSAAAATTAEEPLTAAKDGPKDYPVLDGTPQAGIGKEPELEGATISEANERAVVAESSN
ncbi:hypothetical protein H4S06_002643, partial [Coemansia sp. BCRC 34490]